MLIKGIAARLGITWSLAQEWAPIARELLEGRPLAQPQSEQPPVVVGRRRRLLRSAKARLGAAAFKASEWMPVPVRRRAAASALKVQTWKAKRRERRKERGRK